MGLEKSQNQFKSANKLKTDYPCNLKLAVFKFLHTNICDNNSCTMCTLFYLQN